jgi:catechol 2,3-dioxygenase-like lactoylglutathione lyase family enzyme
LSPIAKAVFETVIYGSDLPAMAEFYRRALGLEVLSQSDLVAVLRCGEGVLLIFDPERSRPAGRAVPSHGTQGEGHLAFAARPEELPAWRDRLREAGVEIEQEVDWEDGGTSLYFRDPAGNSVELAPPTLWGGGWRFPEADGTV